MSRQKAEGGAYGYIAIAAIALAFLIQSIGPGFSQEQKQAADGANRPYYEFVYTYPRLPARCKERARAATSAACEALRNAAPEVDVKLHAPEGMFAGMNIPAV